MVLNKYLPGFDETYCETIYSAVNKVLCGLGKKVKRAGPPYDVFPDGSLIRHDSATNIDRVVKTNWKVIK